MGEMKNARFKFRVWDNEEKCYSTACFFLSGEGELYIFIGGVVHKANPERYIVEKCTGLKDKNGRLIYEGGIVFIHSVMTEGVIKFENGSFVFDWRFAKPLAIPILKDTDDVEIVGNIHEGDQ